MRFKDKETRTKTKRIDVIEVEVLKPERLEVNKTESDLLISIFNDAINRTDVTLQTVIFRGVSITGPGTDRTEIHETVEVALEIEKI